MDKPHSSTKENLLSFLDDIAGMTKSALYRMAQILKIPGRSTMTKEELITALEKKKNDPHSVSASSLNMTKEIPGEPAVESQSSLKEQPKPLPEEKRSVTGESLTSIPVEKPSEPAPAAAPGPVWTGEEGPELPREYGKTLLQAMPRDPHWAYVYWEISEETKRRICSEEGEWIFDISEPVLRIYNEDNEFFREVPILLDAMNWYVPLPSGRMYEFELGLKNGEGFFRTIARSNRITLPPAEPSTVTDEQWAIVQEKYEEMMQISGGISFASWGGSAAFMPHVLRQRVRVPWSVPGPGISSWPSSHVLGVSSAGWTEKR